MNDKNLKELIVGKFGTHAFGDKLFEGDNPKRALDFADELMEVLKKEQSNSYVLMKSNFEFSEQEGVKIGLAECPNCGDSVVWNDGCVKCNANFEFSEQSNVVLQEEVMNIFKWLLGEHGDFPEQPEGKGIYYWRTELREKLKPSETKQEVVKDSDIDTCLNIAKGCHDYQGGHHKKELNEAFHHGISTVVNCLESLKEKGVSSYQLKVVHEIGKQSKPK